MDPNVFETANAGFAQAVYESWIENPESVAPEWRRLFERGIIGEEPPPKPAPTPSGSNGSTTLPGTEIKGPAARLAANMEESLSVPTATTFRVVPVRVLEQRRAALNSALKGSGSDRKLSFTHLIGWALVQAAHQHPAMGVTFVRREGTPVRIEPDGTHLGLAVDVERKDGSRGLVVPVLRHADRMDFPSFLATYESLVDRARHHRLMPDDFVGATITLTNPGGLGTSASVPRLMAGQACIVAVGAIAHPAEYHDVPADRVAGLGISKVMTITSTYDHRVIQGAESGEFLRTMDRLLQGEETFYEDVAEQLGVSLLPRVEPPIPAAPSLVRSVATPDGTPDLQCVAAAMGLIRSYRTHGHLAAHLDPLGTEPVGDPALDPECLGLSPEVMASIPSSILRIAVPGDTLAEAFPEFRNRYCGTLAYEIEHVSNHEERTWLRETIESGAHRVSLDAASQVALLGHLTRVEALERFLHKAYLGQKRFSIEGVDMLVPMLEATLQSAARQGAHEVVIGMAHRGRLNVLAHIIGRPYVAIFAEFEGTPHPGSEHEEEMGTGDVKYHHGAEGAFPTESGRAITVTLAHNPSHLEFVGPVVDGRARAEQTQRRGHEIYHDPRVALPVIIHGDAAFAGQGVVAETLNLGGLAGYRTGGSLHIITNNQVGFTTDVRDARSTMYASDLAKGFDIPIIHVNADDPEACLSATRLAMMYREKFSQDVLIDLVGYRRHGHNEGDEPAYTQPRMSAMIRNHPTVREIYAQRLVTAGVVTREVVEARYDEAYAHLVEVQQGFKATSPKATISLSRPKAIAPSDIHTAVPADSLELLNSQLLQWPEGFTVHPKLARQLERRREAFAPGGTLDWGHAEALALASLLAEGVPLRMTGQDTERGTFSHRHLVLHDAKTNDRYAPIQHLPGALAPFELHNSPLSELATLGFEYGYSAAAPEVLVLWEAQFGDFINGAQVIVDQFLVSGLSKWGMTTRLTLLLPHGYEGQGPEHSSARMERFLQMAAENNIRVANCTTPAQYFHLLRRQALRNRQRPLIVFTPKSLLRHPRAVSSVPELANGTFQRVLNDPWAAQRPESISRLVLCTGKVYYDLLQEAETLQVGRPALARVEQLYSFPEIELRTLIGSYPGLEEVVWVQEEPENMGAWTYIRDRLGPLIPEDATLRYAGRPERASPAEGYPGTHQAEQARLVADALAPTG